MKIKKPQRQVSLHLKTSLDITVNILSRDPSNWWSFLFPWMPLVQKLLKARPASKLAQGPVQARSPRISHSLSGLLLQCSTTLTMMFSPLIQLEFPLLPVASHPFSGGFRRGSITPLLPGLVLPWSFAKLTH